MLRANIRTKERCADKKPSDVAPGQKVFFARPLAPRKIKSNSKHNQKVDADDRQIEVRKCLMRRGNLCCKGHSYLPGPRAHLGALFDCFFPAISRPDRPSGVYNSTSPCSIPDSRHHRLPLTSSSPQFLKLFLAPFPFLRDTVRRCIGAKR